MKAQEALELTQIALDIAAISDRVNAVASKSTTDPAQILIAGRLFQLASDLVSTASHIGARADEISRLKDKETP